MSKTYEPKGLKWTVAETGRQEMLCTDEKSNFFHWILFKHPDGNWVSQRKATVEEIAELIAEVSHSRREKTL